MNFSELKVTVMAIAIHQANKAYCEALGDFSQVDYCHAPANIRDSACDGIRYALENPEVTPEQMHENWCQFKLNDGWRYGEIKDANLKTHPCLVPYDKLPEAQRKKDDLVLGTIAQMKIPFALIEGNQ
jgi:hypothetical protein